MKTKTRCYFCGTATRNLRSFMAVSAWVGLDARRIEQKVKACRPCIKERIARYNGRERSLRKRFRPFRIRKAKAKK